VIRAARGRVVVAMSGGVDSSVAAALLARGGWEVVGVTMRNFCYGDLPAGSGASCCSLEAIEDARRVADAIGFPHYVLDFEEDFGRAVVDDFVREYAAGRTPNPCVRCNRLVRFPRLFSRARALGADRLATGHYARLGRDVGGRPTLLRGADRAKDQSYYLWGLTPRVLERTLFPIGHLTKSQVRAAAAEIGLEVAEKPESQEVCFVPDGDLRGFLQREVSARGLSADALAKFRPGPAVDAAGRELGTHPGSGWLTVGQRRGVGLALGEPRYVIELRQPNTAVLGTREDLAAGGCDLHEVNWTAGAPPAAELDAEVQVRHRAEPVEARVEPVSSTAARIRFGRPVTAVAPGQSAAIYRGDELLGGGVIRRALPRSDGAREPVGV
jgi:tRNA-specific 2-thiouridylase